MNNTNILQQVIIYAENQLGYLQNLNCFISTWNKEYEEFNKRPANLGDTINIQLPYRATANNGLVVNFAGVQQLVQPLVCDQAANSSNAFNIQDFIFNAEQFMTKFGEGRIRELSAKVESNVALNANSSVPVMVVDTNGNSVPTGALHTESGPFLFYGDGVTPINTFQQLAEMEASQDNFGAPNGEYKVYLPNMAVPQIIGTGLNNFALDRNNELANSWDLGRYKGSGATYYKSNLLPIQNAGTLGNNGTVLTLVSTNDPTGNNVTQLTLSGAGTDLQAVHAGDLGYFLDGVSGQPNMRYLTYTGHLPSDNKVQVRATASSASSGGNVTITITPALQWTAGLNQNLNNALAAGMQFKLLPSHRCGLLVAGNAGYLAMPQMPDERPYDSYTATDPDTKVSIRNYYGSQFGKNSRGYVCDLIWSSTLVPWYSRRIIFPLSQFS